MKATEASFGNYLLTYLFKKRKKVPLAPFPSLNIFSLTRKA